MKRCNRARGMVHVSKVGHASFGSSAAAVGRALDMVVLVLSSDNGEHDVPSAYHHQPAEPSLMICIGHDRQWAPHLQMALPVCP
jgi:hypothetical protein